MESARVSGASKRLTHLKLVVESLSATWRFSRYGFDPGLAQIDTGWSKLQVLGTLNLPIESLLVTDYRRGPVKIWDTPHFQFLQHRDSSQSGATGEYLRYVEDQYGLSKAASRLRAARFLKLAEEFLPTREDAKICVVFRNGRWRVIDGFHRLAIQAHRNGTAEAVVRSALVSSKESV